MTENRYIETRVGDNSPEPVNLTALKLWMNLTSSDYDDLLNDDILPTARARVEQFTHLPLVAKDIVLTVDVCKPIILPYGVIDILTSVEYLQGQNTDGSNDWLTLDIADRDYQLLGQEIKEIHSNYTGIHRITYTTDVRSEAGLLTTVKMVANWLFRNRLDEPAAMPLSIFDHAKPFKIYSWG